MVEPEEAAASPKQVYKQSAANDSDSSPTYEWR